MRCYIMAVSVNLCHLPNIQLLSVYCMSESYLDEVLL